MFKRLNIVSTSILVLLALVIAACAPVAAPTPAAVPATAVPQPTAMPATAMPQSTAVPPTAAAATAPTAATTNAPAAAKELTVFAAASLTASFKEIGTAFQAAHPGVTVVFNFAGSQVLSTQLKEGAKADVFASANGTEMENVRNAGLADNSDEIFVNNRLVVIVPSDNPGKVETLKDLAKPGLKLVIAEKAVPVGGYTLSMLDKMSADAAYGADFGATVLKNVVSQENNVKAVVTKVALGEADAGVVYVTDATPDVMSKLKTIAVPDKFNQIGKYPIIALKEAPQPELAKEFVDSVLSKDGGQAILQKWNFIAAAPEILATNQVTVKDAAGKETVVTLADLMALPKTDVKDYALVGKTRGPLGTFSWSGTELKDVLLKADPTVSASNILSVTLTAGDGFKTSVSAAEVFGTPAGKPTILAYEQDGKPMTAIQGIIRLVISSYEFADRQVKWIKSIEVIPAK